MKSQYDGVLSHRGLIETELVRERLYKELLSSFNRWLFDHQPSLKWTEMQMAHILLRYIFNKKATVSGPTSDPVFVIGTSPLARRQLDKDLTYGNVPDSSELADFIDHHLLLAALFMSSKEIAMDEQVHLSQPTGEKLMYRDRTQADFAQLAKRYGADYYNAAYALGLRYSYLPLGGHGFARIYKDATSLSSNSPLACECFASAFNHYFDRYYSAFPDLEMFFGSNGCFFKLRWEQEPPGITYFLCPPFDETLMQLCANCVLHALNDRLVVGAAFVISIPGSWTNFNPLEQLKRSSWVLKTTYYPKSKLPFLDYMSNDKPDTVFPTDVCELILTNGDAIGMDCSKPVAVTPLQK